MANNERDAAKERRWRDVLRRHAASGLSVRAFCLREKLTESGFYAWRRTVAERNGEVKSPRAPAFLPLMVTDRSAGGAWAEMELAGGRILRLPESMPVERLAELVRALEASAPR
jgi:hypothetical protein